MYVQNKYYKILQSSKYDDMESIKMNYKRIIFENHPDRGGSEDFAKEVNMAWEIIKKHHIQQPRPSSKQKTNNKSTNTHKNKNKASKQKTKTNKKSNAKSNKKSTNYKKENKERHKNNRKCSNCGSQYEENDVFCDQCGHKIHRKKDNDGELAGMLCAGIIVIGIGLLLLSLCWPFGIIYFYVFYKFISD